MSPSYKFGLSSPRFSVEELQVLLITRFTVFPYFKRFTQKSFACVKVVNTWKVFISGASRSFS